MAIKCLLNALMTMTKAEQVASAVGRVGHQRALQSAVSQNDEPAMGLLKNDWKKTQVKVNWPC